MPRPWPGAGLMVALAYVVLSLGYGLVNPPFESPDEIHHYDYIEELLRTRRLPVAELGAGLNEFHQPPLYYIAAAIFTAWIPVEGPAYSVVQRNPFWGWRIGEVGTDNKNQYIVDPTLRSYHQNLWLRVHTLRAFSVLLGLVVVWQTGLLARLWRPNQPALAVTAMAFVAFLPQFLFISSSITNDAAATGISAVVMTLTSHWLLEPKGRLRLAMSLGTLLGFAVLTKASLLLLWAAVVAIVSLYLLRTPSAPPVKRLKTIGAVGGLPALMAAPIAWRNWLAYGDPTALSRMDAIWGRREPPLSLSLTLATEVPNTWTSFWARFGYGQIPVPNWVYGLCLVLVLLAGMGCIHALRRELRAMASGRRWVLGFLVIILGVFIAATFRYSQTSFTGAQGRFLFPALSVIGLLMAIGWRQWGFGLGVSSLKLATAFAVAWFAFPVWTLLTILRPAYVAPMSFVALDDLSLSGGVRLDDVALVRRAAVLDPPLRPGDDAHVEVEWLALQRTDHPLAVFVQLLGPGETKLGARDSYPGTGRVSTTLWQPGQLLIDRYTVPVDADVARELAPAQIRVAVGLYDLGTGPPLPAYSWPAGERLDPPVVDFVKLPPPPESRISPPFPPGLAVIGGALQLDAVDFPSEAKVGEPQRLSLAWTVLQPLDCDCAVFLHVLSPDSAILITQRDAPILDGRYPVVLWSAGERLSEAYVLTLPESLAPGSYPLILGLYDRGSGERLAVSTSTSTELSDHVELGAVRVSP